MAYKVGLKKNINISKVVSKIVVTILALWVGGEILTEVADAMNGTSSPFFKGLDLIGFEQNELNVASVNQTNLDAWCDETGLGQCLRGDIDSSGILGVVGLIGIASIVMEFVSLKMY